MNRINVSSLALDSLNRLIPYSADVLEVALKVATQYGTVVGDDGYIKRVSTHLFRGNDVVKFTSIVMEDPVTQEWKLCDVFAGWRKPTLARHSKEYRFSTI